MERRSLLWKAEVEVLPLVVYKSLSLSKTSVSRMWQGGGLRFPVVPSSMIKSGSGSGAIYR